MKINLGKVGYVSRGAWSNAETYYPKDIVQLDGSSWEAIAENTNIQPGTNGSIWRVFAAKGDTGKAFEYSDFTTEQIAELKRPATEAAERADASAEKADTAANNANNAAKNAEAATKNANDVANETKELSEQVTNNEKERASAEEERVSAESTRNINESQRIKSEQIRESSESTRKSNEQLRISTEQLRENAEQLRKQAEQLRVTAEQLRVSAESLREQSEKERQDNEQLREQEFSNLDSSVKNLIKDTQDNLTKLDSALQESSKLIQDTTDALNNINQTNSDISKAETIRVNSENDRILNENNRKQAESTRESNENTRQTNETTRQQNEQTRQTKETERQTAETKRISAEEARVTEFATLKQNAETATKNANDAANNANSVVANALVKTEQTLTDEEKAQVQTNIGVKDTVDIIGLGLAQSDIEVLYQGKYRTKAGTIADSNSYIISKPINIQKGDIIIITAYGSTNVSVASRLNSLGNYLESLIIGTSNSNTFTILFNNDCQIELCWNIGLNSSFKLYRSNLKTDIYIKGGYNRALFEAAGAVFNEKTGFYELNGLTDITEEQMADIYNNTNNAFTYAQGSYSFTSSTFRTNLNNRNQEIFYNTSIKGSDLFKSAKIEVLSFRNSTTIEGYPSLDTLNYTFYSCTELRRILKPIRIDQVEKTTNAFRRCEKLVDCQLYGLKLDISFADSPLLSKDSILYMIQNSLAASAITITLHADAYAMAMADEDIQAALEEKTYVSLASA